MARKKTYKPESKKTWKGKSYKKGGKRVRDLRDKQVMKDTTSNGLNR